jgi:hypothetical protein
LSKQFVQNFAESFFIQLYRFTRSPKLSVLAP